MKKKVIQYLVISFVWTWTLWLLGYFFSKGAGHDLSTDATLFDLFTKFSDSSAMFAQIIFALAVFGPLIGYLIVSPKQQGAFVGHIKRDFAALAIIIPIVSALPAILLSILLGYSDTQKISFGTLVPIMLYFVSNVLTSGTEEFGWRGFLYPYMKENECSFWRLTLKTGILWAIWHYPLMFILYWGQGLVTLLPSLIGFTAGIIAMAYIANFIYARTSSIGLAMLMHALNNTASFAVVLFFPKTPFVFLSSVMAWVVVGYLEKRYKIDNKAETQ